jgi:hypothetical protein
MLDKSLIGEEEQLYLQCDRCGIKYGDLESTEDYQHIDDCGMCIDCDNEIEIK